MWSLFNVLSNLHTTDVKLTGFKVLRCFKHYFHDYIFKEKFQVTFFMNLRVLVLLLLLLLCRC